MPAKLIDQRFGFGAVAGEAINDGVPELYSKALEEKKIRPMAQPEFNVEEDCASGCEGSCWQPDRASPATQHTTHMTAATSPRIAARLFATIASPPHRLAFKEGSSQLTWSLTPHLHTGAFARPLRREAERLTRSPGARDAPFTDGTTYT